MRHPVDIGDHMRSMNDYVRIALTLYDQGISYARIRDRLLTIYGLDGDTADGIVRLVMMHHNRSTPADRQVRFAEVCPLNPTIIEDAKRFWSSGYKADETIRILSGRHRISDKCLYYPIHELFHDLDEQERELL